MRFRCTNGSGRMERLRGAGDMREEYMSEEGSQDRGERVVSSGRAKYATLPIHYMGLLPTS